MQVPKHAIDAAVDATAAPGLTHLTHEEYVQVVAREVLAAMLEPVAIVCMNGRRYGHGLFCDIEVQYPETTTPPPTIGTQLYRIKP